MQAPQAAQRPRGLLGGFFGPEGRDARSRLAIGLEGLAMNPNQALIGQLEQGIESRATAAQTNATIEWLRSRGHDDLAAALEAGASPQDVLGESMRRMQPADPLDAINLRKAQLELAGMENPQPEFRRATPEEAAAYGAQGGQFGPDGRFYAVDVPQGMTLESDGAGGIRMVQGPVGAVGSGKPLTEAQSKFAVFQTDMNQASQTINTLEETYDPTNFQDAVSGVLGEKWGSFLQTPQGQIYRSAAYQWLDSGIRIRTGAAATTDEINRQYAAMFPQPGDLPETVDYKRRARENFMRSVDVALTNVREPLAPPAPANVLEPSGNAPAGGAPVVIDGVTIRKVN